ncbi:MAG: hypothetical protein AB1792_02660 [Candidatus Zixiibacteriota bacterium]
MGQKIRHSAFVAAACVLAVAGGLVVHAAEKSSVDKITAYLGPGATPNKAIVTVWMTNVNPVVGITLPFKFAPGADSVMLDSLLTTQGRAASFHVTQPLYKKENQTLLVNMLAGMDSVAILAGAIPPGEGLLATLFFSSKSAFPTEAFKMAAVRLPPENNLLFVTNSFNSIQPEFELIKKPAPPWPPKTGQKTTKESGKAGDR